MNSLHQPDRESMVERFTRSAQIDANSWRDPQHDLEAIELATPAERIAIEQFLIVRGISHFIDVEALVLLDTPSAHQALRAAFQNGSKDIRAAVAYLAPQLIEDDVRIADLIRRVEQCDAYENLDITLRQIESTHPPMVIHAMLQRIVREPGVAAVHFAGLLLHLHGQASEPFDWHQRPFLLRFNPGDDSDRRQAFKELCDRIHHDAERYDEQWPHV